MPSPPAEGPSPSHLRSLPRRDPDARAALAAAARGARPVSAAHERVVTVPGPLGMLLPGGGLRRGAVIAVDGAPGAGSTSVALALAAAVTASGEWVAAVDLESTLGGRAAFEAGVALERFAVVRPARNGALPPDHWATTVAVLLDGVSLVLAELPRSVRLADARRLVARAREREVILVLLEHTAQGVTWPADATLRVRAAGGAWPGLAAGLLVERTVQVQVQGRGRATRPRSGAVARARAG